MNIPKQPINQRILKYLITVLIVVGSIWSASGLEITPERFLTAPSKVWILVTAMFPLDLSQEAIDRIVPKSRRIPFHCLGWNCYWCNI